MNYDFNIERIYWAFEFKDSIASWFQHMENFEWKSEHRTQGIIMLAASKIADGTSCNHTWSSLWLFYCIYRWFLNKHPPSTTTLRTFPEDDETRWIKALGIFGVVIPKPAPASKCIHHSIKYIARQQASVNDHEDRVYPIECVRHCTHPLHSKEKICIKD